MCSAFIAPPWGCRFPTRWTSGRGTKPRSASGLSEVSMSFTPHGRHLIAGEWVATAATFASAPAQGPAHRFASGDAALVDRAVRAAEEAFAEFGWTSREARAAFLEVVAEELEARGPQITEIAMQETGLPEARLQGERGRTTGQLRLF